MRAIVYSKKFALQVKRNAIILISDTIQIIKMAKKNELFKLFAIENAKKNIIKNGQTLSFKHYLN